MNNAFFEWSLTVAVVCTNSYYTLVSSEWFVYSVADGGCKAESHISLRLQF